MLALQPLLLGLLIVFFDTGRLALGFGLHLSTFFVTAMVCHGELARTRPHAGRLTEFYIWMSLGGVLGGTFSGIIAPILFESVIEYPVALVLACALRPGMFAGTPSERARDLAYPLLLGLGYLAAAQKIPAAGEELTKVLLGVTAVTTCGLLYAFRKRVARFALAAALMLGVSHGAVGPGVVIAQERSFFGVHRVIVDSSGAYHVLTNGRTVHGAEYMVRELFREPLTYYTRQGPAGQVFRVIRKTRPRALIGAVGLGSGAITCLLGPEQHLTYFEIDPEVAALVSNPKHFLYLSACGRNVQIVYGDGRRSLGNVDDGSFDLLVLDAFSSDAIPAHLLTREAVSMYADKLRPGGILLMHISNRRLDLVPVAGAVTAAAGLSARVQRHKHDDPALERAYHWPSVWVVAAREESSLAGFDADGRWRRFDAEHPARPWTDDYSNVAGAIKWNKLW